MKGLVEAYGDRLESSGADAGCRTFEGVVRPPGLFVVVLTAGFFEFPDNLSRILDEEVEQLTEKLFISEPLQALDDCMVQKGHFLQLIP